MEKEEYTKLGFKCGLEIHQQLDTNKLFCSCPSVLRSDNPDYTVERRLHAIAGESGEIDIAAKHEAELGKKFFYQGYDTTCLVELDEEPPHKLNREALEITLQISIFLKAKISSFSQIMRKTVIDGSNTTGFQRTVLIAKNGYIETSQGKVKIESICLEEDAARIIERDKDKVIYRLDRLGIPLVEITTSSDIKNPEQAKEVALLLGNILRSCKVKRGIGTIRQDVNISIKGHPRVELKGVQNMKTFIKTIENEVERQKNNIKIKRLFSEVRRVNIDSNSEFLRPVPGAARMYPETDLPLLKISRKLIDNAKKNLPELRTDIEDELKQKGLNSEMIKLLLKQNKLEEFKQLLEIIPKPKLIAKILLIFPKEISSHKKISIERINKILEEQIFDVLSLVKKEKISESQIKHILEEIIEGKNLEEAVKNEEVDMLDVEERILRIIKSKQGLSEKAYMGLVMKELKGKIDGKKAFEIIKKYLK
jgi:Glu-tRNA(Gln) amidotransferase subunit E-like FAD-binding protein